MDYLYCLYNIVCLVLYIIVLILQDNVVDDDDFNFFGEESVGFLFKIQEVINILI